MDITLRTSQTLTCHFFVLHPDDKNQAKIVREVVTSADTEISRVYHLDRGYEDFEGKLSGLGAVIRREKE